jgi:hypothetical protein
MESSSRRETWRTVIFGIGRWGFFAVALALLPIMASAIGQFDRPGNRFDWEELVEHGELLLVASAVVGAALAELFPRRETPFRTATLFASGWASLVILASSVWFADIASAVRDGVQLDSHMIAVSSLAIFGCAVVSGLSCLVLAALAEGLE